MSNTQMLTANAEANSSTSDLTIRALTRYAAVIGVEGREYLAGVRRQVCVNLLGENTMTYIEGYCEKIGNFNLVMVALHEGLITFKSKRLCPGCGGLDEGCEDCYGYCSERQFENSLSPINLERVYALNRYKDAYAEARKLSLFTKEGRKARLEAFEKIRELIQVLGVRRARRAKNRFYHPDQPHNYLEFWFNLTSEELLAI